MNITACCENCKNCAIFSHRDKLFCSAPCANQHFGIPDSDVEDTDEEDDEQETQCDNIYCPGGKGWDTGQKLFCSPSCGNVELPYLEDIIRGDWHGCILGYFTIREMIYRLENLTYISGFAITYSDDESDEERDDFESEDEECPPLYDDTWRQPPYYPHMCAA